MPIYAYECTECGAEEEHIQRFSDPPMTQCASCGGGLQKQLSAVAFHLKGGGSYKDGYASQKPSDAGGKPDASKSAESSSKSSESSAKSAESSAKSSESSAKSSNSGAKAAAE